MFIFCLVHRLTEACTLFVFLQALPSNSLIILDNDDIWRRVYIEQLTRVLSSFHTERLDYAGQLDMENIMHNMTKVSKFTFYLLLMEFKCYLYFSF